MTGIRYSKEHEWIKGSHRAVPGYLASVTLPIAGIRMVLKRRPAEAGEGYSL